MVSLKAVQAAMTEAAASGDPLKEEIALLGGLTRIEYVLVFPKTMISSLRTIRELDCRCNRNHRWDGKRPADCLPGRLVGCLSVDVT